MILRLLFVLLMLLPSVAGAATYWEDTFEDGILSDTWDISECGASPPAAGCNAAISSDFAYNGTKSLKSTYHPTCTTCQQGTFYDRYFPATEDIWTRSYVRTTAFTYDAAAGSKYYYLHNPSMGYPNFFLINWFGSRRMGFASQGEAGLCPNGVGPYDSCDYFPNMAAVDLNDNQWYCIEAHVKMNTPGQPDGMAEIFVDGTQTLGYYNRTFRGPNATNGPAGNNFGSNTMTALRHYTQHGAGNRYTDDLAVGTTRIGCGGTPPPTDTTAPSPPTSPTATASGTTVSTTWTLGSDNTGGSGLAGTVVLRCTGAACTPTTTVTTIASPGVGYQAPGLTAGTVYGWAFKSQDNAGNLSGATTPVYATTGTTFRTTLYTDSFSQADENPLSSGGKWVGGYTGAVNLQVLSGRAIGTTTDPVDAVMVYSDTTPNDQHIAVTFPTITEEILGAGLFPGLLLRWADTPTRSGYSCLLSGLNEVRIEETTAGSDATLAVSGFINWQDGDQMRGEAEGTSLRCYHVRGTSETLMVSATDGTYASGKTGIRSYTGVAITDAQFDNVVIGEFAGTPPAAPSITGFTVDATGGNLTFGAVTPTTIRIVTGTNGSGVYRSVVEPIASFPAGRYTYAWEDGLDFVCAYPRDATGAENTASDDYRCATLTGVVAALDVTPPTLTACTPTSALPFGTTSAVISCVLNKPATAKYDTTDAAYGTLANAMDRTALTVSATVTGLTDGSTTTYYLRAQSTDSLNGLHPMTTSATVTVQVLAAPAADTTAPSTVTNLVCTATSQNQQECVWSAATDNVAVAGYQVYVATGSCSTYTLAGQPVPTTVTLLALAANTVHCTKIKAIDTSNNPSAAFSNVATVTTSALPDFTPPSDMANLRLIGTYRNSVVLKSNPGTDDRGSVTTTIEVSPAGCGAFVFVYSKLALEAFIPNLAPGTTYCARGKFSDGTNLSANYSNTVQFTTKAAGLVQPRNTIPFGQPRLPRN